MTVISGGDTDYATITEGCGLLDRSDRGKLALTGADTKLFLQGQLTNDVEALSAGHGLYAAFLTQKGKMLGDLRVLDTDQELLLDTERPVLQELFNMIRRYSLGYQVQLHKRTLERGLLALIGPDTDRVLTALGVTLGAQEHDHAAATIGGAELRAIRTDTGAELLCEADALATVREAVLAQGAREVTEEAAECVRIERGRPRYGHELDDGVIPQEAGLNARAVSFTKGCYVGQETVARLFYRGKPNRELHGLRAQQPLTVGASLRTPDRVVGTVSSAAVSPRLGPIGLALVRREAPPGTTIATDSGLPVDIVELPF